VLTRILALKITITVNYLMSNLTLEEIIEIIKKALNESAKFDEEFTKYIREAIINSVTN
jgi:siroheme synthase (precorrin-2 oxidase/ferrochelatase)